MNPAQKIVMMFIACQLLAILAGVTLIESAKIVPEIKEISVSPIDNPEDPLNAVFFLGYVLAGAAGVLLVIRFTKTRLLFFALEFMVLSGSVWILALGLLHASGFFTLDDEIIYSALFGFLFACAKLFQPKLKNIAAVMSSAGVGALFGFSVGFIPALLFIIGISVYDYVAVFFTRHMLKLSTALGTSDLSFTVTASSSPQKQKPLPQQMAFMQQSASGAHSTLPKSSQAKPLSSHPHPIPSSANPSTHSDDYSGMERLDLGSGDLAMPAMLAVAAYPVAGIIGSLAVAAGATISLYLLLDIVIHKRVALPAMPPISLGALFALFIVMLLGI